MLKGILLITVISVGIGYYFAYTSSYTPISKQIDLKTMSLKKPDFLVSKRNSCIGNCTNYSSSSSYGGGGSFGGK